MNENVRRWVEVERAVRALRRQHDKHEREGRRADRFAAAAVIAVLVLLALALMFGGCGSVSLAPADGGAGDVNPKIDVVSSDSHAAAGAGGAGGAGGAAAGASGAAGSGGRGGAAGAPCWTAANLEGDPSCRPCSNHCSACPALGACAPARSNALIWYVAECGACP